jgi:hypothetical protein
MKSLARGKKGGARFKAVRRDAALGDFFRVFGAGNCRWRSGFFSAGKLFPKDECDNPAVFGNCCGNARPLPRRPLSAGSGRIIPAGGVRNGPVLIASGAVPAGLAGPGTLDGKATSLNNPWGGATEVYVLRVGNDHFIVIFTGNVPVAACARIIAGNVDPMAPLFTIATTAVADGAGSTGVWT